MMEYRKFRILSHVKVKLGLFSLGIAMGFRGFASGFCFYHRGEQVGGQLTHRDVKICEA